MKQTKLTFFLLAVISIAASCSRGTIELIPEQKGSKVTLRLSLYEQTPFDEPSGITTKAVTAVQNVSTKINYAIYDGSGKEESVVQNLGDEGYGSLSLYLKQGIHQVVIIAHNGDASATITSPEKISFNNKVGPKMTDTFYYYGEINVGAQSQTYDIVLNRAVAMVRFDITDEIPQNVTQMKFVMTGGSSTLNAQTGFGCVKSTQTEIIEVNGTSSFDLYTFPHSNTGEVKVNVSALDENGNVVKEREFTQIPVTKNKITKYSGQFFAGGTSAYTISNIDLQVEADWLGETEVSF